MATHSEDEPAPPDRYTAERQRRERIIADVCEHLKRADEAIRRADALLRRIYARLAERRRRSPH
jgi:hypothetical protein